MSEIREFLGAQPPRKRGPKARHLPEGCPVTVLGSDGRTFHYLNAAGQYVAVEAQKHSKNTLTALFAPEIEWCIKHYPKTIDKDTGKPRDWRVDEVTRDLMAEAQARGASWEPADNIHGRGVWPGEDGDLRLHLGNRLIVGGKERPCGRIGERVYPLGYPWDGPAPDAQAAGAAGPAAEALALFGCWRWAEPELAPRLLLGWVVAAFLSGALAWRPHVWVSAPRGAGKSTLLAALGHMLQRDRFLLASEMASAASVRALLRFDARPVVLDEAEPSEDNRKLNDVVDLMRIASTGGTVMRATVDQAVVTQTVRFVALAASVVRPALRAQDASRIAVLTMLKPQPGTAAPLLRPAVLELLGRRLFRRAVDGWKRWPETWQLWREALAQQGLEGRAQDQYGTLLAAAWIAEHDLEPDTDTLMEWAAAVARATEDDRAEERPEWYRLIETLAGIVLRDEATRSERAVGEWISIARQGWREPDPQTGTLVPVSADRAEAANRLLRRYGLAFVPALDEATRLPLRVPYDDEPPAAPSVQRAGQLAGHVAVANAHPQLARLLDRTPWSARAGSDGAWRGVLKQAPGVSPAERTVRFGGFPARAMLVPAELFTAEVPLE